MKNLSALALFACMIVCGGCQKSAETRYLQALNRGQQLLESKDYSKAVLEFKNATQAKPDDAQAHFQLGVAYLGLQDVRSAVSAFRRCTELNPSNAAAQVKLAELLVAARDPEVLGDAAKRMTTLLARNSKDSEALRTLAYAELGLGQFEQAETHLTAAVENAPGNVKAAIALAQLRFSQGKRDEAEQILQKMVSENPKLSIAHQQLGDFYLSAHRSADARREMQIATDLDRTNATALLSIAKMNWASGNLIEAAKLFQQTSALPDQQYRTVYAAFLWQTGKRDEAIRELERLTTADRKDGRARHLLAEAYVATGRENEAVRLIDAALAQNPKDSEALLDRARRFIVRGKLAQATLDLNEVLKSNATSAEAHYLSAQVQRSEGNTSRVQAELSEALRFDPQFVPARLELARLLIASIKAASAVELMDAAPGPQKTDPALQGGKNWALLALNRKEDAASAVAKNTAAGKSGELLLQDAILKLGQRDTRGARSVLEQVLAQAPEDTRVLDSMAQSYILEKQPQAALQRVREHAAKYSKSARLQHYLGLWLQRTGADTEARTSFEKARSLNPSFWPADLSLAALDLNENQTEAARRRLRPLLSNPEANLQALPMLAMVEERSGNASAAIEAYRKIATLQSDNVFALNQLAFLLGEQPEGADEALKIAERAKELAPNNPAVDDTLGWILCKKGLFRNAVPLLESSVNKQANATRHAHLAVAYAKVGELRKGEQQLRAALKLEPTSAAASLAAQVITQTR